MKMRHMSLRHELFHLEEQILGIGRLAPLSSPQIMYHFSIEFLELAVSCLGLGEGGCDCTALAMH